MQTKYKTAKIVVTHQAGVARGYFTCDTVEEINAHIDSELKKRGIEIDNWQYCPYVDNVYAEKMKDKLNLDPKYVQDISEIKRKPKPDMVLDGLKELNQNIKDFDEILVLGNRHEDEGLGKNLNSIYIDVNDKTCDDMIKEFP